MLCQAGRQALLVCCCCSTEPSSLSCLLVCLPACPSSAWVPADPGVLPARGSSIWTSSSHLPGLSHLPGPSALPCWPASPTCLACPGLPARSHEDALHAHPLLQTHIRAASPHLVTPLGRNLLSCCFPASGLWAAVCRGRRTQTAPCWQQHCTLPPPPLARSPTAHSACSKCRCRIKLSRPDRHSSSENGSTSHPGVTVGGGRGGPPLARCSLPLLAAGDLAVIRP